MNNLKLALIGECMIELQETSPGVTTQTFGGDTLNTAIYSARLARELPLQVDYVTAVGQDNFSEKMIRFWETEGVGSGLVQKAARELPGLYYIELDDRGERIFYYWRSASAAKKCFEYADCDRVLLKLAEYDGVYLSGISLAILTAKSRKVLLARVKELAQQGVALYFDCNYRPHLWTSKDEAIDVYRRLYPWSKIVFLTSEEAKILLDVAHGKEAHQVLRAFGAEESVVKNGAGPCTIHCAETIIAVGAEKVDKVVDTTAAGDSFSAVYLVARLFGCTPYDAATMAHKTAAYVVCHKGAIAPLGRMPVTGRDILGCAE
ncbi:MAG: sugar kinase [Desulforhopalus sp.]